MSKAVAVCGRICSGKSSVANYLARSYGWDKISFGEYIRSLAASLGYPPGRASYQSLGQQVFSERGAHTFLYDVVESCGPTSSVHLFDGIRHPPIIEALREVYSDSLVFFLDISDDQRHLRYIQRMSSGDAQLSFQQFLELDKQVVERGIFEIANIADVHLDALKPVRDIVIEIADVLHRRHIIS